MDIIEFSDLLQAEVMGNTNSVEINDLVVSIDSRSLQNNQDTLFFALTGNNHNAHDYIEDLFLEGVRFFVISEYPKIVHTEACYFLVDDTLRALQTYAAYIRSKLSFPIIGITGSKGKTIVKEWLNFLLNPDHNIIKSPKSYNSQTGVALSLFGVNEQHDFGIFEAGISTVDEMIFLEKMLKPTIGVLTSVGEEHQEGFKSFDEKINEKLKLFKDAEIVILNYNDFILEKFKGVNNIFTWSFNDSRAIVKLKLGENQNLIVDYNAKTFDVKIPFTDEISIENISISITVMLALGYSEEIIQERIPNLYPVELRLQVKNGRNGCLVIDDSYNSDYQSLKIALDFLEKHKKNEKKTVILSDIFQSGFSQENLYKNVKNVLEINNVNRIIGIGTSISKHLLGMRNVYLYKTTEDFLQKFNIDEFQNETILIKGARRFRFNRIVSLLEDKTHETVLEVNLNALRHNLNFYRYRLKPETKIMVMVKAYGYGNGSLEIAKLLSHENVDYLGVAFADEGIALRKAGIQLPIIVMNPQKSAFSAMLAYDLEPEIFSLSILKDFLKLARERNEYHYPIHLKIDSGMHRLGFLPKDYEEVIEVLKKTNVLEVKSIFSHLSSSDMPEYRDFSLGQIEEFKKASEILSKGLSIKPIHHILNTSGVYNFGEYQMDMVRIGIGLYGVGNNEEETSSLQNVATLKTIILQIRDIDAEESVGYGRRFRANKKMRIATIPIGYADGIHRSWGNQVGWVYVNGYKAPIVGSICMDMLMIDVTDIACTEGDIVEVFGENLPITTIASKTGTIPYEIMTSISQRVKRIFFEE